jgi:hypothetical protein
MAGYRKIQMSCGIAKRRTYRTVKPPIPSNLAQPEVKFCGKSVVQTWMDATGASCTARSVFFQTSPGRRSDPERFLKMQYLVTPVSTLSLSMAPISPKATASILLRKCHGLHTDKQPDRRTKPIAYLDSSVSTCQFFTARARMPFSVYSSKL